jgi:hypothetical protein
MLQKYTKNLGYNNCVPTKKFFFTNVQKAQRIAFIQAHIHWIIDDWKKYIIINRSSFEIGKHL